MKLRTITILSMFALTFFVGIATSVKAQCVAPPNGMVHWWTGDDNSFDIIGGQHGTLEGGASYDAGKVARAFSLNGTTAYMKVAHNQAAAFNFAGSFTIDAWIYLKSEPTEFAPIVSKWNDINGANRSYFLAVQKWNGVPRIRFDVSANGLFLGGQSSAVVSNDSIPLNTWTHVAGVFDGSNSSLKVYVNGNPSKVAEAVSNVTVPFANTEPVLIGAGDLGSNVRDFFHGGIDEIELYNRALSQAEIQSLVNAGGAGKTIPIQIDIKPDGVPNSINLGSNGNVPVAILSTATFDASTIVVSSLRLAGAPVKQKNNETYQAAMEDVNGDGRLDLVAHFVTKSLLLNSASTEAVVTGMTTNGRCISGSDSVNIVP